MKFPPIGLNLGENLIGINLVSFSFLSSAQEELKNYTISMVEQSKVLNTPGAEKQTKRELFDALRQELE